VTKATLFSDPQLLPSANIHWRDGDPIAEDFDDVYASTTDAMAEKTHVFLQPNQLPQRFAELEDDACFSVLELGFGSGLNFLLTWQLWQQQRQHTPKARLVYTSIEGIPMLLADLQRCQQQWPQLADLAAQLQTQYPLPMKGFHRLELGDVVLNLVFGEVTECLAQIQGEVDAIYLDGFNPAKNDAMWQPHIMQSIAGLCHAGTTLATYSAARMVKDNLQHAGFSLTIDSGYGLKRNQLSAVYSDQTTVKQAYQSPWQQAPEQLPIGSTIAVIGAGISGCSTAMALQQRGYKVQLIEQGPDAGHGASGNKQGMLYAKLPDNVNIAGQLHQQGLNYSMAYLQQGLPAQYWRGCGLLQLAQSDKEAQQMLRVIARQFSDQWLQFVSAQAASDIAGDQLPNGGLWFAKAGWASPVNWCRHLVGELQQTPWFSTCLKQMHYEQGQWCLTLAGEHEGNHTFQGVVLCNASQAKQLLPDLDLPLKSIRGQVSYVAQEQGCDTVVCGEGYVTPVDDGTMAVGASYNLGSDETELDALDHAGNLERLQQLLPDTTRTMEHVVGGRVGFRATTPDYLPMVGQLADAETMLQRFAHLRKDKNYRFTESMPWLAGLYINAGHGSKGLITAPLCGQLLAAQVAGEILPLSRHVAQALSPSRFFLRDMMRRKR
jgi:tRNA 5-methylaminomethyl-2-thiouridine biosynthesis bifunctional protein